MRRLPSSIKVRYFVVVAILINLMTGYIMRSNISVAILEMTTRAPGKSGVSICLSNVTDDTTEKQHILTEKPFAWSEDIIAKILSSYFYGYLITHVPGAIISLLIGPRITMAICIAGCTIGTFISVPLSYYSPEALMGARILIGLFAGPFYPLSHEVIGSWSPVKEKTIISVLANTGNMLGLIISFGIGGVITQSSVDGWKNFHYFSGAFGLATLVLWCAIVWDNPQSHPYISVEEANYIRGADPNAKLPNDNFKTKIKKGIEKIKDIPFRDIFTSGPVYTVIMAHFGYAFALYVLLNSFPSFLSTVYGLETRQASLLATIPFAVCFVIQFIYPLIVDFLRTRGIVQTTFIRKVNSAIGFFGSGIFIMTSTQFGCDKIAVNVVFISIAMALWSFNNSGYFTGMIALAPKYAGFIMGVASIFGSITGFLTPELSRYFTDRYEIKYGWTISFYIIGCIAFITIIPYLIWGSSDVQPWAEGRGKEREAAKEANEVEMSEKPRSKTPSVRSEETPNEKLEDDTEDKQSESISASASE